MSQECQGWRAGPGAVRVIKGLLTVNLRHSRQTVTDGNLRYEESWCFTVSSERSAAAVIGLSTLQVEDIFLSRHGGIMTYLFIARFLARCQCAALIGARP
jgi:hypothetical protein